MAEVVRVYLDTCCIQRPTDDLRQDRVRREAEEVREILALWEKQELCLLRSPVLLRELLATPDFRKRAAGLRIVGAFLPVQMRDPGGVTILLGRLGLRAFDAQQIAAAAAGQAAYFVTCDDGIIKRRREVARICNLDVVSPAELLDRIRRQA